ncbi:uncharacterized protein EAF02_000857 [Botrytis sinoallii]|uniref:uncharacterized protein n=1 Tax=Botrytis sinoallii TaxID=1463999 RepID=UPI0019019ADD|nr:uncharacterized protein EAF02_000857 [Botrytis sinoallii]KAF7893319.1 hypothetical protein EAF02_000857 [Botrytis sinoallii]
MQPRNANPKIMVSDSEIKSTNMQSSLKNEVRPHSRNPTFNVAPLGMTYYGHYSPGQRCRLPLSSTPQQEPTSAESALPGSSNLTTPSPIDKVRSTKSTSHYLSPPTPPRNQDDKILSLIRRIFEVNNRDTNFLTLWKPHLDGLTSTTCMRNRIALEMVAGLQNLRNREVKSGIYKFVLGMFWGHLSSYVFGVSTGVGLAILMVYAFVSWKVWHEIWDEESFLNLYV